MGALLHDAVIIHYDDAVGVADGTEPMGDDEGGTPLGQFVKGPLDAGFGDRVQSGGGLIQNENRRVFQEDAGDGHPLLLSAGQHDASLTHIGLEAVRHVHDIVVDLRPLGRLDDLILGGIGPAIADIVQDGAGEEEHVLLDDADVLP